MEERELMITFYPLFEDLVPERFNYIIYNFKEVICLKNTLKEMREKKNEERKI